MIVYDNYARVDFNEDTWYNRFPRVVVELYPCRRWRWCWEVAVNDGDPIWTHFWEHDGSRVGLRRAIRAAVNAGYEAETLSYEEAKRKLDNNW